MRRALILSFFALLLLARAPIHADAEQLSFATVQHGRELVIAGDCAACHTTSTDQPFAGGLAIATPFGTIYSSNITPDGASGIGSWSSDDFWRAMHLGVRPTGERLYPAFPYPNFTKLTRDDVDAIWTYLRTVKPIRSKSPANDLIWPLNHRVFVRGWNLLFFDAGEFQRNPAKSDAWNRGAYLVEGAAHCGACHTAKNMFGADKTSAVLQGGVLQNWFAPDITDQDRTGLRSWSDDDIVEYLKTGRNRISGATGIMAEVVSNSTSHMSDSDLRAIAVYLKDSPGGEEPKPAAPHRSAMDAGKGIYGASCAACHQGSGEGVARMFPRLKGNPNVQSRDPTSVIRVILDGARTVTTNPRPTPSSMPAYDWKLSDDEIAAVATYVRNAWGNVAPEVSAGDVRSLRKALNTAAH